MTAPTPWNEAARLDALKSYRVLDSESEAAFDDLAHLAAQICGAPMAAISLIDSQRQWFKSRVGVTLCETPRDVAFCAHGIVSTGEIFAVDDALEDLRFADSPLVRGEPYIRFYCGARLVNPEGYALGMLCVMDRAPRKLDGSQKESLRRLARQVVAQLELRRELAGHKAVRERMEENQRLTRELAEQYSLIINNLKKAVFQTDAAGLWTFLNPAWEEITGFTVKESLGKLFLDYIHPDDRARNQALFQPLIERKKDYCRHEVRYLTKAGGYRWIEVFARLTLDPKDNIIGTLGTLYDVTERKSAEVNLQESERLYHSLVEHLPLFILRKDATGRFTFGNKFICDALHCSPEEIVGKTDFDFVPRAVAERFREIDRRVLTTGEVIETVENMPQPNGEMLHVRIVTTPLCDSAGAITGVQIISNDITRQHRLELELRAAHDELEHRVEERTAQLAAVNASLIKAQELAVEWKKRYDLIVASSGLAIYDADQLTGEVVWGNGAERILGQPVSALNRAAGSFLDLVHPEDRTTLADALGRAITSGMSYDVQYRLRNGFGEYLWIEDHGLFVRDENGRCLRVLGMMENVTERKVAEDKMREQAMLLDKTHDAIMVRDLDHRVLYWNQTAERLYGWSANEAIGKSVHDLLPDGSLGQLARARAIALKEGEWSGEIKVFNRAGREMTINSRWTLLRDHDGTARGFLVAHTDLTERKLLEEKFYRSQRLENIGALAGGIAHDLNNVFTPILMAAQLLDREMDSAARSHMVGLLKTSAERGSAMVKQVLSFTRGLQSGVGVVQIKHLVKEIEKMMRETFPRDIRIHAKASRDLLPVRGDATQLYQIMLNLCVNARDAMPAGGELNIDAFNVELNPAQTALHKNKRGPHICVTVSDTGTGIPPEIQPKIFEPFFTTKETGKGTGLGLSTVQALVQAHSGFMEFESTAGAGTRFKIFLAADCMPGGEKAATVEKPPGGQGELLLVVEDESAIREIVKSTLEAHDYNVLLAAEGNEALALYASNGDKIALVITDLAMPVMDGYATIRALRKMNPKVKIIAVSGLAESEALKKMTEATGVTTLAKPYSPHKLLTAIHDTLHAGQRNSRAG